MPAETTDAFLDAIRAANLLDAPRMDDLAAWAGQVKPTPHVLAAEINRRGWLTGYQIKEVYHGRGDELLLGPYILQDLLGTGGMGKVFKAQHTRLGREVALKVIRKEKVSKPAVVARFHQEIRAASQLSHPNVVLALDADEANGIHYFAMEYVEGTDLTKLVLQHGPMPIPQACDAIRQSAIGLQHAHERGLVHRDVKPSNLLLTPRGQVKVLDLGLAMLHDATGGENANRVTQEGLVLGTPDFLAPEQARNPLGVDARADVYSLGATLFYLLTARVPFDGATPADKLLAHVSTPPPNLLSFRPDAPQPIEAIIHWLMAKRPEDRPQTAAQVAAALAPFCPQSSGLLQVPSRPTFEQPVAQPVAPTVTWTVPALVAEALPDSALATPRRVRQPVERPRSRGGLKVAVLAAVGLAVCGFGGLAYVLIDKFVGTSPPTETFTNFAGMKMVRLDGGTFPMGSPDGEPRRDRNEGPAGDVTLSGPFFISATEITNGQFKAVMNRTNAKWPTRMKEPKDFPEDSVTWEDANEFCKKLNARETNRATGWAYRLPTEAEWEYAARAGTRTPFWSGDKLTLGPHGLFDIELEQQAKGELGVEDPNREKVERNIPHPAGTTEANAFGLTEVHGNVWEWCLDFYTADYESREATDPKGPTAGDLRVLRGGSWRETAAKCRSAARRGEGPTVRRDDVGFRVVYAPSP